MQGKFYYRATDDFLKCSDWKIRLEEPKNKDENGVKIIKIVFSL